MRSSNNENVTKYYFHVYNRGVEKRDIFCEESDYYRFMHDLYEFNDINPTNSNYRGIYGGTTSVNEDREPLLDIICYCLMPNHFHLLVCTTDRTKLALFMKKLGTGYALYFNQKYDRVGSLFQGRFKCKIVESDAYLMHLSRYIHINPVKEITDCNSCKDKLFSYNYSSFQDYAGKKHFPSLIRKGVLESYYENAKDYVNFVLSSEKSDLIKEISID